MAGNVREWGVNEIRDERERRVTLGGRWNDPGYMFTLADNVPAFDRSSGNGLRLVSSTLAARWSPVSSRVPLHEHWGSG